MPFITNQCEIETSVTQVFEDIASPTREDKADLFRSWQNVAT